MCSIPPYIHSTLHTIRSIGWNIIRIKVISKAEASRCVLGVGQSGHSNGDSTITKTTSTQLSKKELPFININ